MESTPAKSDSSGLSIGQLASIACLLEVAAPKPGNVHRSADFEDMTFQDFQLSAVAVGPVFENATSDGVGATVLKAIEATRQVTSVNTNLGLILLLAPLAAVPADQTLPDGIGPVLDQLTSDDASLVYKAIQLARPGGIGQLDEMDVHDTAPSDLLEAMRQARQRDMVARQYSDRFEDLLVEFVPWLIEELSPQRSLADSIVRLQLRIMAEFPDSLIARKCGLEVARQAAAQASEVFSCEDGPRYHEKLSDLDFWLRSDHHERNPGTTADLVGATLFAALRDGQLSVLIDSHDLAGVV
jgi:triphosphoribosyl-dephospho-CoA synthase